MLRTKVLNDLNKYVMAQHIGNKVFKVIWEENKCYFVIFVLEK